MQYKVFREDITLSRLGLGAMRFPETEDHQIDYPKAKEIIDLCYHSGINYYDTAYIYNGGQSEVVLAKALREYPRRTYYIADKYNFQASRDYRAQFAQQLEKMELEYIDFYLLHGIQDNFVDDILACGCIDYFHEMKRTGKIRYFGFSFHGNDESLKKVLEAYDDWDFAQIQLNYYDWEYGNQQSQYKTLKAAGLPMMIMEPVHGGLLARTDTPWAKKMLAMEPERSVASWAMRWLLGLDGIQVVLSGMGSMEMVRDNVKTFTEDKSLNAEESALVKEAAKAIWNSIAMPCTGCRYCMPNCPMGLDIPDLLVQYNDAKVDPYGGWRLQGLLGMPEEKRPTACIGCGACTEHCPQQLPIPKAMQEMAEILSKM